MDLQSMMTRDPGSGFPQIVGQIHQNLDFDNLVQCRAVSKTWKQFLENPKHRDIWINAIDQDRKKYRLTSKLPDRQKPVC